MLDGLGALASCGVEPDGCAGEAASRGPAAFDASALAPRGAGVAVSSAGEPAEPGVLRACSAAVPAAARVLVRFSARVALAASVASGSEWPTPLAASPPKQPSENTPTPSSAPSPLRAEK